MVSFILWPAALSRSLPFPPAAMAVRELTVFAPLALLYSLPARRKPKKRRGEDIRDPEHVEKVVIPVAKKPITKSYVAQTILGSASAFAAIAFVLLPDLAASAVFGLGDIAHMTRPMVTLVGALLGFKATLFLVLRELSYSYSSTKTGEPVTNVTNE